MFRGKDKKIVKILNTLMLWFCIVTVTAAGFSGFFSKWAFRDNDGEKFGIVAMIEGTAAKPFVYRRLVPETAEFIEKLIPEQTKEKISKRIEEKGAIESVYSRAKIPDKHRIEYIVIFVITFITFLASIFVLRSLLCEVSGNSVAGTLGALLFALLIPYIETNGGYFYDFPELLFMFLGARFAYRGQWLPFIIMAPLAAYNKESYSAFMLSLVPLFMGKYSVKKSVLIVFGALCVSAIPNIYVHWVYANNIGLAGEMHVLEHLKSIINIKTYFYTGTTYGVPLPTKFFFLHIIYVVWIVKSTFSRLPISWRRHIKWAAAVNFPLYFFFCASDEIRNLSFLLVGFMVMATYYIGVVIRSHCKSGEEKDLERFNL